MKMDEDLWARYQPELRALAPEQLATVNLDIPIVVSTILGALPDILKLRADFDRTFRSFPFHVLDTLKDYALLLQYAHGRMLAYAAIPRHCSTELMEEAKKLRANLYDDVKALERRELIDPGKCRAVQNARTPQLVVDDLAVLAKALREASVNLRGRVLTPKPDIDRAVQLSKEITAALKHDASSPLKKSMIVDDRVRAYTLAVRAYDRIRRAINYMRHDQGDADKIAPSLFAGRDQSRRGRRKKKDASKTGPGDVVPA